MKETILELQEKVKRIIYDNSSSLERESINHLKAKDYEFQCSIGLVILLYLPNALQ